MSLTASRRAHIVLLIATVVLSDLLDQFSQVVVDGHVSTTAVSKVQITAGT